MSPRTVHFDGQPERSMFTMLDIYDLLYGDLGTDGWLVSIKNEEFS